MKKFNFRKIGILLVMIFVGGAALAGHVDAYTGNWTYDEDPTGIVSVYIAYSSYPWGLIYAGSTQSYVGPTDLEYNIVIYNTDAETNPGCIGTGYGTTISSGLKAYYSDDETVDLHDYHPWAENLGRVGSKYYSAVAYADTE